MVLDTVLFTYDEAEEEDREEDLSWGGSVRAWVEMVEVDVGDEKEGGEGEPGRMLVVKGTWVEIQGDGEDAKTVEDEVE